MSVTTVGLIVLLFVFILMFFRVPIAIAMAVPSILGILYLRDWNILLSVIDTVVWKNSYSYALTSIPLFVLMGNLIYASGISSELYTFFRSWLGNFRGGLAMSTIGSSAMFAAASGSSLATTSTIGVMASKEMLQAGYSKSVTGGSIAAGGTLGILIPPSTMMIVYGMITEQSIGKLLVAGILPGILLTILFMITIYIVSFIKPDLIAKKSDYKITWKERFDSFKSIVWILVLFFIVIGGIYAGIFTATEAAGAGAVGALIIALARRKLTIKKFNNAIFETVKTTGFIFAIVIGAYILNYVLTITRIPNLISDLLFSYDLSPTMLFVLIVIMYIILGAFMDGISMVVLTMPIILPLLEGVGFDLIWFGVIIVLVVEMGLITPPVGINCFVLNGVVQELELKDIFKGALIFVIPILVAIIIVYIFPDIALFLPNTLKS